MPAPVDDLNISAAPPAAPAPKAKPVPVPASEPVKVAAPKDEPPPVPAPPRYRILAPCVRHKPGQVVDRAELRPNAPFTSEDDAEAATEAAVARLLSLGVIAPE